MEINKFINDDVDVTSLKVLIVDDTPMNLVLMNKLMTFYTFECIYCKNGEEALEAIDNNVIDLILLDIMMPKISGWDILEMNNNNKFGKHIPIICLSALNDSKSIERAKKLGADDWVDKPILSTFFNSMGNVINKYYSKYGDIH